MKWFGAVAVAMFVLVGCGQRVQETVQERNAVLGTRSVKSNFLEAQQISEMETWKDNPGKIVNVYIINPVTGGLLIPPIQCKGVPVSSTESMEPNTGTDRVAGGYLPWQVPIDGEDIYTEELAGRDGTYGDPVHFRQCMTVDGNYIDWPAYGGMIIVSSASYSFPEATIQRDFEAEARLLKAEEIIKRGGCVNVETLEEEACK